MDLRVLVTDESDVEGDIVDARFAAGFVVESNDGSVSGIITASAPVVSDDVVWHREIAGQGGRAGAIGYCKHAIWDSWSAKVAESFGFPPRSITGSSTVLMPQGVMSIHCVLLHLLTLCLLAFRCLCLTH